MTDEIKSQTVTKVVFLLGYFKESDNKNYRHKVSRSINFNFFTIFPKTYVRISPQTISKASTNFYVPVVPENWPSAQDSGYVYVYCTN